MTNIEYLEFTDQTIDLSTWPVITSTTTPAGLGSGDYSGDPVYTTDDGVNAPSTLSAVDISTRAGAVAALERFDSVLDTLAAQLATMGALQNRLSASISNLTNQAAAAEVAIGRILNADFATEMAILTKSMVLAEAANQVLAGSQLSKSNLVKLLK